MGFTRSIAWIYLYTLWPTVGTLGWNNLNIDKPSYYVAWPDAGLRDIPLEQFGNISFLNVHNIQNAMSNRAYESFLTILLYRRWIPWSKGIRLQECLENLTGNFEDNRSTLQNLIELWEWCGCGIFRDRWCNITEAQRFKDHNIITNVRSVLINIAYCWYLVLSF